MCAAGPLRIWLTTDVGDDRIAYTDEGNSALGMLYLSTEKAKEHVTSGWWIPTFDPIHDLLKIVDDEIS